MVRKPLPVPLDEAERKIVDELSQLWGISKAAAIRRIIREYELRTIKPANKSSHNA